MDRVLAEVSIKRLRVTTVVLCAMLVLLSLMVIVGLALSSSPAGGRCLLYADTTDFGPQSVCTCIYVVVSLFQLILGLARASLNVAVMLPVGLVKDKGDLLLGTPAAMASYAIADVIACFLTLVCGGLISHGFSVMCNSVFHPYSEKCGSLSFYSMTTSSFVKNYYTQLNVAQAAIWISFFVWILLILADVLLLWKAGILTQLADRFRGDRNNSNSTDNTDNSAAVKGVRRDRETNHSQRSFVALLFRKSPRGDGEESDTDSGPRTPPPPQRPAPPRPPVSGGDASSTK